MAFIGVEKTTSMNFKFLIISIVITSGLVGNVFAQQEFSQEEIDEMKQKAVLHYYERRNFYDRVFS